MTRLREQALTKYAAGVRSDVVCRDLGVHHQTLRKWVRTAGLPLQVADKPRHSEATKAEAIRLYAESDFRMDEIAASLGVNDKTVYRWVKAAGVPYRGHGAPGRARPPRDMPVSSGRPACHDCGGATVPTGSCSTCTTCGSTGGCG